MKIKAFLTISKFGEQLFETHFKGRFLYSSACFQMCFCSIQFPVNHWSNLSKLHFLLCGLMPLDKQQQTELSEQGYY